MASIAHEMFTTPDVTPSNVVGVRGGKVHLGTADEFPVCRSGGQDSGRTHYRTTDAVANCKACGC